MSLPGFGDSATWGACTNPRDPRYPGDPEDFGLEACPDCKQLVCSADLIKVDEKHFVCEDCSEFYAEENVCE